MRHGPDEIVECPHCGSPARVATMKSGNTLGMRVWSDGWRHAPMLVNRPLLAECATCGGCYFLHRARWAMAECPDTTPGVREPSESAYYEAIRRGMAHDRDEERLLRMRAWWRSNDARRHSTDPVPSTSVSGGHERLGNLRALLLLLSDDEDGDRVIKAEVLRQLGRWSEAEALLDHAHSAEHRPIAEQLRAWCALRNDRVQELRTQPRRAIVIRL